VAGELALTGYTGQTYYAVLARVSDSAHWRVATAVFEAYNASNWALYAVALAEGDPGEYGPADLPSGFPTVTAGAYEARYYRRVGGSPATSDPRVNSEVLAAGGGSGGSFVRTTARRLAP
jgi:hypothetical protein